jgi:hypothetical protein
MPFVEALDDFRFERDDAGRDLRAAAGSQQLRDQHEIRALPFFRVAVDERSADAGSMQLHQCVKELLGLRAAERLSAGEPCDFALTE